MHYGPMREALCLRGLHPTISRAAMRELSGMRCSISMLGKEPSERFNMETGGKQGGVETPEVFNAMIEWALDPLAQSWAERGMGFDFENGHPPLS